MLHSGIFHPVLKATLLILTFSACSSIYADTVSKSIRESTGSEVRMVKPPEQAEKENKNQKKEIDISTGSILSGSGRDILVDEIPDIGTSKTEEEAREEEKLKKDINTYIIESYKAQGSKIVKELSIKLTQTLPDPKDRQEAYKKIRSSLELRLERIVRVKMSDTKKLILQEFLSHIISLLNKKVEELS